MDNKRLGRALEFISLVQSKRDNTRSQSVPSGDGPSRRRPREEGKKSQRSLNNDDMLEALKQLQSQSEAIFGLHYNVLCKQAAAKRPVYHNAYYIMLIK